MPLCRAVLSLLAALLLATGAAALEGKPKLGPGAVPLTTAQDYLRRAPAPDPWPLAASAASDLDLVLACFNQGVLTGDRDGPRISPIGACDALTGRVLIMDVDREWYIPYWASDGGLLEAMLRPAPAKHGPLAGETGGLVRLRLPPRR
jgi:hypothetical protein